MTASLTPAAERAVRDYLDDLGRMLETTPPAERAELLGEVREHIESALAETAGATADRELDTAEVTTVLGRIGAPSHIAAGALGSMGAPPATAPATPLVPRVPLLERTWLPWLIVGLMVLGAIPFLGWVAVVAGIVLFWRSPLWGRTAKVLGTIAYVAPLVVLATMLLATGVASADDGGGFHPPAQEDFGTGIFLPASYDIVWTLVVGTPLWCVPVAVVLALVAGRNRARRTSES